MDRILSNFIRNVDPWESRFVFVIELKEIVYFISCAIEHLFGFMFDRVVVLSAAFTPLIVNYFDKVFIVSVYADDFSGKNISFALDEF